jgi:hypothetical protein
VKMTSLSSKIKQNEIPNNVKRLPVIGVAT